MNTLTYFLVVAAVISCTWCEGCTKPKVTPKVFISSETVLTPDVVIVGEFTVQCSNKPQSLNFLAELNGDFFPVTQSIDGDSYQFTITKKTKEFAVSTYTVNVYDEQAAASIRKAQAAGKSAKEAEVKPTFTIPVDYQGPNKGLLIPTEFIALGGGITFSMLAFHARSQISN